MTKLIANVPRRAPKAVKVMDVVYSLDSEGYLVGPDGRDIPPEHAVRLLSNTKKIWRVEQAVQAPAEPPVPTPVEPVIETAPVEVIPAIEPSIPTEAEVVPSVEIQPEAEIIEAEAAAVEPEEVEEEVESDAQENNEENQSEPRRRRRRRRGQQ